MCLYHPAELLGILDMVGGLADQGGYEFCQMFRAVVCYASYTADYWPKGYVAFVDLGQAIETRRGVSCGVDLPPDLIIYRLCVFEGLQNRNQFSFVLLSGVFC